MDINRANKIKRFYYRFRIALLWLLLILFVLIMSL